MSTRIGRRPVPMPEGLDPWSGTLADVGARAGVSPYIVRRWRRETPRPPKPPAPPKVDGRKRRGRRNMPGEERVVALESQYPGVIALLESNAPDTAIGRAYGVSRQAVAQWRVEVES